MIPSFLKRLIPGHTTNWWERYFLVILAGAALLFMVICLTIGLHQSVWFDEAYSIMIAKQPAGQLVHLTSLDTHPPFYYLLLKGWATLFGWSELALRSLSVVAAGFAVFFAGLLMRRMFGVRAALITLPFAVFAPFLLRYGFEIRMYALASLISIAATYVLVRAQQTKEGRDQWLLYVLYGMLVALGVYTLYYTVLLWVAHLLWLIWVTRQQKQSIVKAPWMRAFGISFLLFLPWIPAFVMQIGNGALASISQPLTINNLMSIVSFWTVYEPTWQLSAFMSLLVLFVIVCVAYFVIKALRVVSAKQRPYLMLLIAYFGVPIAILMLVSLAHPVYVERYIAHIALGGMLFAGACVSLSLTRENRKEWWLVGGIIVVLLFGVVRLAQVGNFNFQRLQTPMMKLASASIRDCEQGTTVFAADPYVAIELAYYLPHCQIHFYSKSAILKGGFAPLSNSPLRVGDSARELSSSRKLYYVYYGQQRNVMPDTLKQVSISSFNTVNIATFVIE